MACYHPLKVGKSLMPDPDTGKRRLVINPAKALIEGSSFLIPCGHCIGCRLDRSKQWAIRCMHEAMMHESNCFVTLTQDPANRARSNSLVKRDLQLFHMRVQARYGQGIKYFGCGEYGKHDDNPHYHSLLLGHDFADKRLWSERNGLPVWKSAELEELWPAGISEIGSVSAKSARYVAGYVMKKFSGPTQEHHYTRLSPLDGQVYVVEPEFALMSRRPGLGSSWFDKYQGDAFPCDYLIVDGVKVKPPRYYLDKLVGRGAVDAAHARPGHWLSDQVDDASRIKRVRKSHSVQPAQRANGTRARLAVREEVQRLRLTRLKPSL